jgi:hypothetical protein
VNPLPEFLEPISEFEMWRDYREKRNRRAIYFLALLLILLIVASALPSSTGPVFGTGNTVSNETDPDGTPVEVIAGADGQDGEDGLNGRPGRDGQDGEDGAPGLPGASGPAGPPGASGSGGGGSSSSSGTSLGQGVLRVGTCDTDIAASLRSRIAVSGGSTVFYFKTISLSGIDSACNGKNIDIYLLDSSGNTLATALTGTVSGATHSVEHTSFSTANILASTVDSIALEIAD